MADGYKGRFEQAKIDANTIIQQTLTSISNELQNSVSTLKAARQVVTLDIQQVVTELNAAREDWLEDMKEIFNEGVLKVKMELEQFQSHSRSSH